MTEWEPFHGTWEAFERAGLAYAGVMVEVEGEEFLIGDIDRYGGHCGHCRPFDRHARVGRYTVVVVKSVPRAEGVMEEG